MITEGNAVSFGEMLGYLRRNSGLYTVIFAGVVASSLGTAGWNAWIVAALGRTWGLSPATVGKTIGTLGLVIFPLSAFIVGMLMDFARRWWNRPDAPFWVAIGCCVLNIGPAMLVLHSPSLTVMWIAYSFFLFLTTAGVQAACGYMLATVTPGRLMGKVTSCYYLTNNMISGTMAPTIVAAISQYAFEGPRSLISALTISYSTFLTLAVLVLYAGTRQIRRWHGRNLAAAAA